ncbi:MAG TPA: hypothetical protein VFW65_36715 [Pseudonocardiaceae bacterium]|nr:hypothetical protein [Pseudonocardiaceae bacterium]
MFDELDPESARAATRQLAAGTVTPELIEFLGAVAEAALVDPALRQAVRESYPVVAGFLSHADRSVRKKAVDAAVSHVKTLTDQRPALAARLHAWANDPSEERAFWVRQLSELDDDTERYLTDPTWRCASAPRWHPTSRTTPQRPTSSSPRWTATSSTRSMVANPRIWNNEVGNSPQVFRQAGLPFDRAARAGH